MHKELALAAIVLPTTLVAQSTTWTSFEDRRGHTMAATPTGGVVMFGGQSVTQPGVTLGDTNRLSTNNQTWSGGNDGPEPRREHAMAGATIAAQPSYIVFGGINASGVPVATTYRYDGSAWGDLTPLSTMAPTARSGHSLTTNLATQTMLLFGGFDGNLSQNDVWEFSPGSASWTPHFVNGTSPTPRYGHCMAYHPHSGGATGRFYLFGGSPFRNDLWEFDPYADTWTQKAPPSSPPGRRKAAMAYLAGQGELVLFGGLSAGGIIRNDTWAYDPTTDTWRQDFPTATPPARQEHAMSADSTGNNLILLGGTNAAGEVLEGTWLWSSSTFQWVAQLPTPADRDGAAMAYDSVRNRHVVFGGRLTASGTTTAETWEVDGLNWRNPAPTSQPPARSDAALCYRSAPGSLPGQGRTLLYGGRSQSGTELNDTYEWNGSSWSVLSPVGLPPAAGGIKAVHDPVANMSWTAIKTASTLAGFNADRLCMWGWNGTHWVPDPTLFPGPVAAAFDELRNEVVLVGGPRTASGYTASASAVHILHVDAASGRHRWRQPTGSSPAGRFSGGMAFDSVRGQVVLSGGHVGSTVLRDLWTWDGSNWVDRTSVLPAQFTARTGIGAAMVPGLGGVVLFGGVTDLTGWPYVMSAQTWLWDGNSLSGVPISQSPSPRGFVAAAYDSARGRMMIFGGDLPWGVLSDELYELHGGAWTLVPAATRPSPRGSAHACFIPSSGHFLVHGGQSGATPLADTWLWDGLTWVQSNGSSPGSRFSGAMVSMNGTPGVFGGWSQQWVAIGDAWSWNGGGWSSMGVEHPLSRTNYGMAYDSRRARVVVFGGMSSNDRLSAAYFDDTWTWDGGRWLRIAGSGPSPRGWMAMAYDASRDMVVGTGGADATTVYDDTWEFDGQSWQSRSPLARHPGGERNAFSYDDSRRLTVSYGSMGLWDYGPVNAAAATSYGAGCATSAGGPLTLTPKPWAGPWLGDRFEADFQFQPAQSLGIFLWGFSNSVSAFGPLPFNLGFFNSPACNMLASAEATELLFPGTTTYTSFVLPNHPSFLGAVMFGQAGYFDTGLGGVPVTSNGLRMTFGQK